MQNDNDNPTGKSGGAKAARRLGGLGLLIIALAAITSGDRSANAQSARLFAAPAVVYDGGGFSDFRRQAQLRLLSAMDEMLADKAEDALLDEFALKKAEVQLQTELGGREGQLAFNAVAAFTESENHAFGWQLRAYGGIEDSKGANAGVFYRRVNDGTVFGGNVFADYEVRDYESFARYSLGGEVRTGYFDLAANYYVPITGDKTINTANATITAFSRRGYDAHVRIGVPQVKFFKAGLDYYHFEGKHGAAADKGFRYGAHLRPFSGLRVDVFYDNGASEFGGDITYSHTIGEAPQKPKADAPFIPDLFAPVRREHSQRIVLATAAALASGPTSGPFTVLRTGNNSVFVTDYSGAVGIISGAGGSGGYSFTLSGGDGDFSLETVNASADVNVANSRAVRFLRAAVGAKTATIVVSDSNPQTPPISVILTAEAVAQCDFIDGCPALGHGRFIIPPLSLATLLANAGADVNSEQSALYGNIAVCPHQDTRFCTIQTPFEENSRAGIIAQFAALHVTGDSASDSFENIIPFLLLRDADINYQRMNGAPETDGQTALDVVNGYSPDANVFPKSALVENGARCNLRCRTGDRNIAGQICTRDTDAGENCRP